MIKPNVSCVIVKKGETDMFGKPTEGARIKTKCNVVKLIVTNDKSTVRADSSATRGRAHEETSTSVLLFYPKSGIAMGDMVEVAGINLEVNSIHTRFDVRGNLDHLEVGLVVWE
jgi:hypothetical protein